MTGIWKRRSVWALAIAMFAMFSVGDVYAQRSRSSGSRPRTSTPSRSRSSSSSSKSKSSSSSTKSKSSWGSSKSSTASASKGSSADKALYEKAKRNGTTFQSRSDATNAFKAKYAKQYSNKFDKEPAARPDYIPKTYSSGGQTYNVTYNQQYGGYGYMGPSGAWIMYDAMADAAMMSVLMRNNGYYYGAPPAYGTGGGTIALVVVGGIVIVVIIGAIVVSKGGGL